MTPAERRRKAQLAAADSRAAIDRADHLEHEAQQNAAEKIAYMTDQDHVTRDVLDWIDFVGVDPRKETRAYVEPYAQQASMHNGSANTPHRTSGGTTERMTIHRPTTSHIIKVGNDYFSGDPDGRDQFYVEFIAVKGETSRGVRRKHLKSRFPRLADDASESANVVRRGLARISRGPVLGTHTVQDNGVDYVSRIGVRLFRGPDVDDPRVPGFLVDRGTPRARFDESVTIVGHSGNNESALCEVGTYEALLLNRANRRRIDAPARVAADPSSTPGQMAAARLSAAGAHIPYPERVAGRPNPLTEIDDLLAEIVDPAVGFARAVDIP